MKIRFSIILALVASFASSGSYANERADMKLSVPDPVSKVLPGSIDPNNAKQLDQLSGQLGEKRAIFIGEVHDQVAHHQNQLQVIKSLYAHNHDLAIGVEYLQQPFQAYLDDYIAGRIDEKEMLVKTEYFKRWQLDYRLLRPIFQFAREKHIPVLALNVPDEIHNKVFRGGMKSLSPAELAQTPQSIYPASAHYLQRLQEIFNSHPVSNDFGNFVDGVLLWDESMADAAAKYLEEHPRSQVVVLAGMVHVMYGDGIPERLDQKLGRGRSVVMLNGNAFDNYPGVADYLLSTQSGLSLPKAGKLGVLIADSQGGVRVSNFTSGSAALDTGIAVGDRIVALNGVKVANIPELKSVLFDKLPGDQVQVIVQRNHAADSKKEIEFDVKLR